MDEPTRRVLASLARDRDGLLEGHGAKWSLDALIGLDPEAKLDVSPEQATGKRELGRPAVTKEQVIDCIDMVCDALEDIYRIPTQSAQARVPRRVVSARIPGRLGAVEANRVRDR